MKNFNLKEERQHGAADFPVQYYHIDSSHPRYEMNLHWHPEFEVVRVLSGELCLYLNNVEYDMTAGEIAFVGGGVLHRAEPKNCLYECVVFDLNMLARHGPDRIASYVLSLLSGEVENRPVSQDIALSRAANTLFDTLQRKEAYFELEAFAAIALLLHRLYAAGRVHAEKKGMRAGHKRHVMLLLLDWIEQNYTEHITLKQLAEVARTDSKYLCRFFKEYTGSSPIDYINRLRVERACLCMVVGQGNTTEAALDNGFNDISYFCKIFKRYKGVTPREYCRLLENAQDERQKRYKGKA